MYEIILWILAVIECTPTLLIKKQKYANDKTDEIVLKNVFWQYVVLHFFHQACKFIRAATTSRFILLYERRRGSNIFGSCRARRVFSQFRSVFPSNSENAFVPFMSVPSVKIARLPFRWRRSQKTFFKKFRCLVRIFFDCINSDRIIQFNFLRNEV